MNALTRIFEWFYTQSLKFYPRDFRARFGSEMLAVFRSALEDSITRSRYQLLLLLTREIRDWPGAIWREHLCSRKGGDMDGQKLAWKPLNTKELLMGLALFVLPLFSPLLKWVFGYRTIINQIGSIFTIALLIIVLIILIWGIKNGFPRWSVPYLGVAISSIVFLELSYRLWGLIATDVKRIIKYHTKTLAVRIQYSALMHGFFWFLVFVVLILSVLLLMSWPRTRKLAQQVRQDWTLISFMIFGSVVFQLELVFEEYAYDEPWKIACRVCLALGALIYFKNADHRKRILALLVGITLTYWIAAIGKWVVLPLQSWGAWYGNDHWTYRRFELGSTLAQWGWVMLFMLVPSLMNLIPWSKKIDSIHEETLASA
jgi:hypothetical protein